MRMPLIGYLHGIRSERRLCDEVHLNLAYRWFCRLGLDGSVPDHSTFSKNRHGRFRDGDVHSSTHSRTTGSATGWSNVESRSSPRPVDTCLLS